MIFGPNVGAAGPGSNTVLGHVKHKMRAFRGGQLVRVCCCGNLCDGMLADSEAGPLFVWTDAFGFHSEAKPFESDRAKVGTVA